MSTRKLILTALACGIAILIAGSIQLLRLSSSDSSAAKVFRLGETALISGVAATVEATSTSNEFAVRLEQTEDPVLFDPLIDYWALQVGSIETRPLSDSSCSTDESGVAAPQTTCTLVFEAADGTRYLRFRKDGNVATWLIEQ